MTSRGPDWRCGHDPSEWPFERQFNAETVVYIHTCPVCGSISRKVCPPKTTAEHLYCLSTAIDELGAAIREAFLSMVPGRRDSNEDRGDD